MEADGKKALVAGADGADNVGSEVVEESEPVVVQGILQFMLPSPDESMRMLHSGIMGIQNTLDSHTDFNQSIVDQLGVMNTTLYHQLSDEKTSPADDEFVMTLQDINTKMDAIAGVFASLPEWIPAHTLKESTGLSVDAIRKQLLNPKYFEPGVDYQQIGKIWHINKSCIPKIRRQK